jgi:hypothetical protein
MITRYASMTTEEREAGGWTPEVYGKMVELQASRDKLAQMFNADGSVAGPDEFAGLHLGPTSRPRPRAQVASRATGPHPAAPA